MNSHQKPYTSLTKGGKDTRTAILIFMVSLIVVCVLIFTKKEDDPSSENEEILEELKSKMLDKYAIGTIKILSDEIHVAIIGTDEYFDSVKDEVEQIVKDTIKSTEYQHSTIQFHQVNIPILPEEYQEDMRLLNEIYTTFQTELRTAYPDQIQQITVGHTNSELSIEIHTEDANTEELEEQIHTIIENKLSSNELINEKPLKIDIKNGTSDQ